MPSGGSEEPSNISKHLEEQRKSLTRLTPSQAFERIKQNPEAILIDTRPASFREAEGAIPGAIIIERNVLEWRLDPTSPDRIPQASGRNFEPIIMCNEGYASSLAAKSLQGLGVTGASDLEGGFRRWKADGLPTIQGDNTSN